MKDRSELPVDSWMGKSDGTWEGDVLVVTTKWQNGQSWLDRAGNHSQQPVDGHRAVHAAGAEPHLVRGHARRPADVYAAVDDRDAVVPADRPERHSCSSTSASRSPTGSSIRTCFRTGRQGVGRMRSGLTRIAAVAGLLVALARLASAHHSFSAEFDSSKQVTLDGEVVMMEWVNPHSWLHIDCEEARRLRRAVEDRRRVAIRADAPGLEPELAAGRHQSHGGRLPGEGRLVPGQFARPPVPRWPADGSRRLGIRGGSGSEVGRAALQPDRSDFASCRHGSHPGPEVLRSRVCSCEPGRESGRRTRLTFRRVARLLGGFAAVLFLPASLYAQASIAGMVRDTSGAVLPGVTVEASSPALIEKVRSGVSDGTGQYRIENLRPGIYSVTVHAGGLQHRAPRRD